MNQTLYPKLLSLAMRGVIFSAVAIAIAPTVAIFACRQRLWGNLELGSEGVTIGQGLIARRFDYSDVLLIRIERKLASPQQSPLVFELPGLVGRRCRVWLAKKDAAACFELLQERCPAAVTVDAWGVEALPAPEQRAAGPLRRLGERYVTHALGSMVVVVGLALCFLGPGLALCFLGPGRRLHDAWFLLLYAMPGVLMLVGLVPCVRQFKRGRELSEKGRVAASLPPVPERGDLAEDSGA